MVPTEVNMPEAEADTQVRPWGNSMGIIIPAEVVRRLNLKTGETIHVKFEYTPARNDPDKLPSWDLATDYDIDEILEEDFKE